MDLIHKVNLIKNRHLSLCIRGTGKIASLYANTVAKALGTNIAYYTDANPNKWGKIISDDIVCKSERELDCDKYAFIVMIGGTVASRICDELNTIGVQVILTWDEIRGLEILQDYFLSISYTRDFNNLRKLCFSPKLPLLKKSSNEKRIAVYTCIVNDYDTLKRPQELSGECDYYVISDKKSDIEQSNWINIKDIIPNYSSDMIRSNRLIKILGYNHLFSDYEYSIYVDGSIVIKQDISNMINLIGDSGIGMYRHPKTNCIFLEAIDVVCQKKDTRDRVLTQMHYYQNEGMPRRYGMFACGLIVRDNRSTVCDTIMNEWWEQINKFSFRDQLSFPYVLWRNCSDLDSVGVISSDSIFDSKDIAVLEHQCYR